jgi:predicted small metal-binding protein
MPERGLDRARQDCTFEVECAGDRQDVVEILEPGIDHAQRHHRLELLRDDGLGRIGAQPRRGLVKQ